ncbi:hypothetical protein [Gordonia sp. NPDC003585]|uniref:TPR repeat region-containing protein n=1 Tax=Gordonia sp. NPDC003585 TaxID=3154275 RepID=UPI0033A8EE1A
MALTKEQVYALDFSNMPPAAKAASSYATSTAHDARTTRDTIFGLDWSGGARAVATDRAAREYTQLNRLSAAFTSLSTTIMRGHTAMSDLAGDLKQTASAYEADSYRVDSDWSVRDTYNYATAEQVAGDDRIAIDALRKLKAARAQIASNGQRTLQKWASDLGAADLRTAAAIRAALARLGEMAPPAAGLSAGLARDIVDALLRGGALTPEQMAALRAACTLPPERLRALRLGRPVDIPQGQYDFLRALALGLNGKSVADIVGLGSGDQKRQIQRFLANGLQMVSTPQLTTRGGDRGGMRVVPASIRSLLTDNLVQGVHQHQSGQYGTETTDRLRVPRIKELQLLTEFLQQGDRGLRLGTDIDRGLFKQASEIAGAVGKKPMSIEGAGLILTADQTTDLLNRTFQLAGQDTTAVHDFITGQNMDVTMPDGAHYNADHHLDALFQYQWGDKPGGIDSLFSWIGESAGARDNPFLAREAAESATALGHYFGDKTNVAIGQDLGLGSPHLTQTLARSFAPYLGDFAGTFYDLGIPKYGAGELSQIELQRVFSTLNSDPTAAGMAHRAGTQWQLYLAYQAGAHDAPQLGKVVGFLGAAMKEGWTTEWAHLKESAYQGQMAEYEHDMKAAALTRNLISAIPHPAIPVINALVPPDLEQSIFGPPPNPDEIEGKELKEYKTEPTFNDPNEFNFVYFAGVLSTHPGLRHQFEACLDENGVLDWKLLDQYDDHGGKYTKWIGENMTKSGWEKVYNDGARAPDNPSQPLPGTIPALPPDDRNPGAGPGG